METSGKNSPTKMAYSKDYKSTTTKMLQKIRRFSISMEKSMALQFLTTKTVRRSVLSHTRMERRRGKILSISLVGTYGKRRSGAVGK